jgi:hypothetical protein
VTGNGWIAERADGRALNDTVFINGCVIWGRIPVPRCAFTVRIGDSGRQGNRALTKDVKKGQRIGRNPKTAKPMSPRRIVVFKPSADLKQRINGHAADNGEWQDPAEQFAGSISRNTH